MHKVYLLLRNNQKTGPYSLDELLQLQLKPFDLVWVEGRSAGWRYPAEIDSLKAYVAEPPKPPTPFEPLPTSALDEKIIEQNVQPIASTPKKVFVSMPGKPKPAYNPIQEEVVHTPPPAPIPQYAPGYQEATYNSYQTTNSNTTRQQQPVEEEYSGLFIPKKTKRPLFGSRSLATLVVIVILAAGGYYVLTAKTVALPSSQNLVSQSVQQPVKEAGEPTDESTNEHNAPLQTIPKMSSKKEKTSIPETAKRNVDKNTVVVVPSDEQSTSIAKQDPPVEEQENKDEVMEDAKSAPQTETVTKEKKKKLGEAIKDIFKPKEKVKQEEKTETVVEDPKPATNRQSTKREDVGADNKKVSESNNAALAEQIDISSNAPDNWMMGVKGLKVTLRNRNNVAIQTATVEVIYYDGNNQVLEKKLIYFNNIAPKGKLTVSAPDHKWADHVDFKIGPVSAKEDRFAIAD